MFGILRKKLRESVEKLAKKTESGGQEAPKPVEKGTLVKFKEKVVTRKLSERDIDDFFSKIEIDLMQSNIAVEVIDFLRESLKETLAGTQIKRGEARKKIQEAFEKGLLEIVDRGDVDLERRIKSKKPLRCIVLGFNGSGKTTTIAKIANYLKGRGYKPVLAAGDTFRAASIEQLEEHGNRLGIRVIKQQYGADAAAVVFDAIKHAEANSYDIILADTAGRMHTDKNLMDELKKMIRVNKPDLKILVVDSLTGNDAVQQAKNFDEAVGVDAVVMTKTDVNEKGGSILSVCYAIKKPILFLGTGQGYDDLKKFNPKEFIRDLLG